MRKVYLIIVILLACGFIGLGLWYQHIGAPTKILADILPGVESRPNTGITFAVIGDNEGDNQIYRNLIQQIASNPEVKFVLHVGDLMANGGSEEIASIKKLNSELGLRVPIYAVPGNHDISNDPNRLAFQNEFGLYPRSIDVEDIHIILLDNADRKVGFSNEALAWLEADLKTWENKKTAKGITIIAYHRPFAYPLSDFLGDDETRISEASNDRFLKILAQHEIAQIYTGHVHTAISYAMVTSRDNTNKPTKTVNVTVSGGGGQPIQNAFGSILQTTHHALLVTFSEGQLTSQTIIPKS